ncbi:hypothetical protein MPDQ_000041 [Monascus purpureus]|uniref:MIT domain-containing protein n=1 Tax=Monascus purpureus TaxID=5098 RepID=A0A507R6R6_MONPU|nr:hypothetical protein MPDQ_000041 [Monascus purpureus]
MAGQIGKEIYKLSARPFILEREGNYEEAIKVYKDAIEALDTTAKKYKKGSMPKINRKMFERQVQVHRERLAYLEELKQKGTFENIIRPPTILDAMEELEEQEGDGQLTLSQVRWTSSDIICIADPIILQIRRDLHSHQKDADQKDSEVPSHLKPFVNVADSSQIPFFTPTLPSTAEPVTYRISNSSELVALGKRSHWIFVKDSTNTHVLYALQAVWSDEAPIVEAILRRAGEFLPQVGAVTVRLRKTRGGSFRLVTSTIPDIGTIVEIPDGEARRKDWSPRRFQYGGRNFVWKSGRADGKRADGGVFRSFAWETLYETKRVWPKSGSKTGKMEDETAGPRLCWGEKGRENGALSSIHMVGGLDMQFREHLLAAQLARLVRCSLPPKKEEPPAAGALETVSAGLGLLSLLAG